MPAASERGPLPAPVVIPLMGSTSAVRARARLFALALGWGEQAVEELSICVSELAQNVLDHGGGRGELRLSAHEQGQAIALEVEDQGPGIDPVRAGQAPRLSGGGNGLATLGRLMDVCRFEFGGLRGDRVRALKRSPPAGTGAAGAGPHAVVIQRVCPRQAVCGDAAMVASAAERLRVGVVDGLGHGEGAHEAAEPAARHLEASLPLSLEQSVREVHEALRGTRGAALGVLELEPARRCCRAATVGNVRVMIFSPEGERWSPLGVDAVLGQGRGSKEGFAVGFPVEEHPWEPGSLALLFSDGLSSRLCLPAPVPTVRADMVRTAFGLFASYVGSRDDATLLLVG